MARLPSNSNPSFKRLHSRIFELLGLRVLRKSAYPTVETLTSVRNQLNHLEGIRANALERLGHTSLDLHLKWIFETLKIDCVLDVGANIGQFATEVRSLGFNGLISSFEPLNHCAAHLRRAAEGQPRWRIFDCALGEKEEARVLTRFNDDTFSSLHTVNRLALQDFGTMVEKTSEQKVEVKTLEAMWAEATKSSQRPLLKIDTQGHDLSVISGAGDRLAEVASILVELSFIPLYDDAPSYLEVAAYLKARGFVCTCICPLSYHNERPVLLEANAIFVNTSFL